MALIVTWYIIGPPAAPEGPMRVVRVTRNSIAIHWQPPQDNGGSPIECYRVEKREVERSHWTQAGTCSPDITAYCITGLVENQMYYLRVVAQNAYGFSEPLDFEKPVIPKRLFGELLHHSIIDNIKIFKK